MKGGSRALGTYQDKSAPTNVESVFKTVLGRLTELPAYDKEFYDYLLSYPHSKRPLNTSDFFYWETVKFGLKPTFRINHVIIRSRQTNRTDGLSQTSSFTPTTIFRQRSTCGCVYPNGIRQTGLLPLDGQRFTAGRTHWDKGQPATPARDLSHAGFRPRGTRAAQGTDRDRTLRK